MQNYKKYIKYKTKYLNLKTQIGGNDGAEETRSGGSSGGAGGAGGSAVSSEETDAVGAGGAVGTGGAGGAECAFCNNTDSITMKENKDGSKYYFCERCKKINRNKHFIYYYNITTNEYITYGIRMERINKAGRTFKTSVLDESKTDHNKNIIEFSEEDKVIVFDVHNVVDRYEPEEFKKIVNTLSKDIKIVILSYVGSITGTRLYTQQYLKDNFSEFDDKFFCFKKSSYCEPGTKGFFMQRLGAEKVILFDDSQKNIDSAFDCGKKAVKIHSDREENDEDIILARKNIEDAINSINDIGFDRFYTSLKKEE